MVDGTVDANPGGGKSNDGKLRRSSSASPSGSKHVERVIRHMHSVPVGSSFGKSSCSGTHPHLQNERNLQVLKESIPKDQSLILNDQSYLVGKPLSPDSKKIIVPSASVVIKNKKRGGIRGIIRRFKSQDSGEQFVEKQVTFLSGKGHVQMGVRAMIMFLQTLVSFAIAYIGIDPWHNSLTMGVQFFNGCTLVHQFYTNWAGDFILRSLTQILRAISAAHAAACGRRSFFAFWWSDEHVAADYAAALALGYPSYLDPHSRVCFNFSDIMAVDERLPVITDLDAAEHDVDAPEVLLPFRVIFCFNCVLLMCYAFAQFMHAVFPHYGALSAHDDDSQPEPEQQEAASARLSPRRAVTSPPDFSFSLVHLCTLFDMEPAVARNAAEGSQRRRVHGCLWIKLRCYLCICLALCQLISGLLKLVLIPDESFFSRESAEITVNFLRFFFRLLAAWSLYIQYWKPRTGWHCGSLEKGVT